MKHLAAIAALAALCAPLHAYVLLNDRWPDGLSRSACSLAPGADRRPIELGRVGRSALAVWNG